MKELDKDKNSTRFPRTTLVASGWIAVIAGVGQFLNDRFLAYQMPLWFVLLLSLVLFSAAGATLHPGKKDQSLAQNDQVFLILCAFNEKRWVAGLIFDLYHSLDRRKFELVLKIPDRDYVHFGQVRHLRNLSERRGSYVGGIISPAEPELLRNELKSFCVSAEYPIIFVDIDPFGAAEDYPTGTAFVGYAPDVIGRCAADYVGEHARRSRIFSPNVLVIGSDKLHIGRQMEFVERLRIQFQEEVKFIIDQSGDFNRSRARAIVHENLSSGQHVTPNYIFCTNDEMALGAVDALSLMGLGNDGSIVVVGVDGISEARALIDSQNAPLRATVVQDSCGIAEKAIDLLDKAIRGQHVEKYNYLDPQILGKPMPYSACTSRWGTRCSVLARASCR